MFYRSSHGPGFLRVRMLGVVTSISVDKKTGTYVASPWVNYLYIGLYINDKVRHFPRHWILCVLIECRGVSETNASIGCLYEWSSWKQDVVLSVACRFTILLRTYDSNHFIYPISNFVFCSLSLRTLDIEIGIHQGWTLPFGFLMATSISFSKGEL